MHLNLKKCFHITFSLKRQPIQFNYSLGNINLLKVSTVHDLGVKFDSKLSFKDHVLYIRNKASKKLGFLKRTCRNFRDESALKTLYYSLIRSHFDYALLIWHPYLVTQIQDLNKIQNNFIRFLCYQCFVYRAPHSDYNVTIRFFNMQSLEQRFMQIKLKFLFKLLNNMIDCPELLQNINFKINSINHRSVNLFYIKHSATNYMRNSPSNILMSTGNSIKNIDFFGNSLNTFMSNVLRNT